MFTQPCFIEKDTVELRKSIEKLGHKYVQCPTYQGTLFVNNGLYSDSLPYNAMLIDSSIDCGENEELFLAIAALRDDSDYMQWFTDESLWCLCDGSRFGGYCAYNDISFDESKMHKATVDELIKHFNK